MADPSTDVLSAVPRPALEARWRELFDSTLLGIYISTPSGTLRACNAAFARLIGFASAAEAIGTNMTALYDSAAAREAFVDEVRAHRRLDQHRGRLRRHDGS